MRGWLIHVVAAVASAGAMLVSLRALSPVDRSMPHGRPVGPDPSGPPPLQFVAPILLVALAMVAMRRWPRAGFVALAVGLIGYGVAGGPSFGMGVPAALGAALLVHRAGLRAAAWWLLLVPLALWSSDWDAAALGLADARTWLGVLTGTVWLLFPAGVVTFIGYRRRAADREHADALERAASDERLRLAREIHDVVGHSLSMISLQSAVALRVLDADPAQARASLEAIRGASKDALGELRHTLGVFRGDEEAPRAPTPTLAAIATLVADVRAGGVAVELAPLPDAAGLGAAEQAAAYRIVQESLTNAVRHAPGHAPSVRLARGPRGLAIHVANTLPGGVDAPLVEGGGLRGMRERADALGGTFAAGRDGGRFVVTATLPGTPASNPEEQEET